MRILLVNNGTAAASLLENYLAEQDVTTVHWDAIADVKDEPFDCAILSGSSKFSVVGHEYELEDEMAFIRAGTFPILGICYGFELITVAFGGTLKKLHEKQQGVSRMTLLADDPLFQDVDTLFVYEGHRWAADTLPPVLQPLARSDHGIEAIKHAERYIYGLQFHPEKMLRETTGKKVLDNFLRIVTSQMIV